MEIDYVSTLRTQCNELKPDFRSSVQYQQIASPPWRKSKHGREHSNPQIA